ncbi:hypothetical protein HK098_000573 [Nowakowskiella sp. JEL0407]|nr:hypothetical protein HK098_000573 [Nowakowskiella sp. JEL0407]
MVVSGITLLGAIVFFAVSSSYAQQGCLTLPNNSICGPDYVDFPVRFATLQAFNDFITQNALNLNSIAANFSDAEYGCSGAAQAVPTDLRWLLTYTCSKTVRAAMNANCTVVSKLTEGPNLCEDQCNEVTKAYTDFFNSPTICPGGSAAQLANRKREVDEVTTYCNQAKAAKVKQKICQNGIGTESANCGWPSLQAGVQNCNGALRNMDTSTKTCCGKIAGNTTTSGNVSASPQATGVPTGTDSGLSLGVIMGIVIAGIVIIGSAIFIVTMLRKKSSDNATGTNSRLKSFAESLRRNQKNGVFPMQSLDSDVKASPPAAMAQFPPENTVSPRLVIADTPSPYIHHLSHQPQLGVSPQLPAQNLSPNPNHTSILMPPNAAALKSPKTSNASPRQAAQNMEYRSSTAISSQPSPSVGYKSPVTQPQQFSPQANYVDQQQQMYSPQQQQQQMFSPAQQQQAMYQQQVYEQQQQQYPQVNDPAMYNQQDQTYAAQQQAEIQQHPPQLLMGANGELFDLNQAIPLVVVHPYEATMPDELTLQLGHEVLMLQEYDDGWALGVLSDGQQGAFPIVCVALPEEIPENFFSQMTSHQQRLSESIRLSKRASSTGVLDLNRLSVPQGAALTQVVAPLELGGNSIRVSKDLGIGKPRSGGSLTRSQIMAAKLAILNSRENAERESSATPPPPEGPAPVPPSTTTQAKTKTRYLTFSARYSYNQELDEGLPDISQAEIDAALASQPQFHDSYYGAGPLSSVP